MSAISSIGYDDLDDLLERTKALQGMSALNTPLEPSIPIPAPHGLSSESSIGLAPKKDPTPHQRPMLAEPRNVYLDLINTTMTSERLAGKSSGLLESQSKEVTEEIERLSNEVQEAINKEAESIKSRDTWATLSNVAQYTLAIGSILGGIMCGGIPGAVLIASGVIGIGSGIIRNTDILKTAVQWYTKSEELQKSIIQFIEMGMFTLQLGLGLAGGVALWHMEAAKYLPYVTTGLSLLTSVTRTGAEWHKWTISDLQARQALLNSQITAKKHDLSTDTSKLNNLLQTIGDQTRETQKIIQSSQISID